jgi:Mce-associated membrane protein
MSGVNARFGPVSTRARRLLFVALCVLAAAAAVGAVITVRGDERADARADAAREGRSFAVDVVPRLLSYDFDTVEQHFGDLQKDLGGDFAGQFQEVGDAVIIPSARERQVVTSATVLESSVVQSDTDNAELLLFINQSTTSAEAPDTKLDGSRVRVHVEKKDGAWLITELTPV